MAESNGARPPTAWERFRAATKHVLSVSKDELTKREAEWRKRRQKRKGNQ